MTEPIGYATLQVIPSLDGVSDSINKQLGAVFPAAGKRGGKDFARGVGEGLKDLEQRVKSASTAVEKLGDKQKDAADAARLAQERYNEAVEKGVTGSRLTAAQNAREKALRRERALTRELEQSVRDLEKAKEDAAKSGEDAGGGFLSGLRGAMSGAGGAGSEAASGFAEGFAGSAALARLGAATGPIGVVLGAAGVIGGGLLAQNLMAGLEREVSADRMAAQLGLSPDQMASFGRSSGEVYAGNFGESLGDVNEGLAAVASTLGSSLPSSALEDITAKALTFRDVFGTDVAESVGLVQRLIVSGLAPDAVSAFDAMVTAYQRVPTAMRDELPEVMGEYAEFTDSLGFSLDEIFGLIVKNAPRGQVALDKVGDALKEFTLLATDLGSKPVQEALFNMGLNGAEVANNLLAGGDTAGEQFDAIVDGLLRIPDAGQQAAAAVALFGTPLEDLDKARIPEFLRGLDNTETAMEGFSGASQRMVDTAGDNAAGAMESAKREIELAVGGVQDSLGEAFSPVVTELAAGISEHKDEIQDFIVGIGKISIVSAGSFAAFTTEMTGGLALIVNAVGDTYGAIATVQANLADLLGDEEKAASFRKQAEEGYGLADSLYDIRDGAAVTRDAMRDAYEAFGKTSDEAGDAAGSVGRLDEGYDNVGSSARTSAGDVEKLNEALAKTPKPADMPWLTLPPGAPPIPGQGAPPGYNPLNPSGVYGNVPAPNGNGGFVIPPIPSTPGGGVGPDGRPLPGQSFGGAGGGAGGSVGASYGLKPGTDIRQGAEGFPPWVYEVGKAFGLTASTYAGHQEDKGQGNQGIDWWGPVENRQKFAEFLAANAASIPGLEDVIYRNPQTGQDIGVNNGRLVGTPGSADPGYFRRGKNDFLDHDDHVHTTQSAPIPLPNGFAPAAAMAYNSGKAGVTSGNAEADKFWDAVAAKESGGRWDNADTGSNGHFGGLQFSPETWKAYGGGEFAPMPHEATREEQIIVADRTAFKGYNGTAPQGLGAWEVISNGSTAADGITVNSPRPGDPATVQGPIDPSVINAFGAGYEPGIGTPGYDEYGKPGYYEVDPKQVREAQQRVEDQAERIREADEAARQAQVAIDELEFDADQSERDAATERKRKADYDAQVARRELEDLKAEVTEAQQGSFSPAKEAPKESKKQGGGGSGFSLSSSFSGLGSAIGEFAGGQVGSFLDVFGVPDSPGWLQAASTLLSGISIGGDSGPLSALPNFGDTKSVASAAGKAAAGMGGGAAARTGPGVTYNITARDTEDAFIRAQRQERERTAAKLSRY